MKAYGVVCFLRTARQGPVVYVRRDGTEMVNVSALFRSASFREQLSLTRQARAGITKEAQTRRKGKQA